MATAAAAVATIATASFARHHRNHHVACHRPLVSTARVHFLSSKPNSLPFFSLSSSSPICAVVHPSTQSPPTYSIKEKQQHEEEEEQKKDEESEVASAAEVLLPSLPCPTLTIKEKKELASYAHGLGKKLKIQQVGKSGVTPSVAASFVENLESNELLKIKVHGNCPMEFIDTVGLLEKATGSVAVSHIGRSVILYRPSISKMKKKESQVAKKAWKPRIRQPTASPGIPSGRLSRSSGNSSYGRHRD